MSDFTRINQPRVDKITAMLDVIDKSAKSQRVDNADHDHLLDPIRRRLGAIEPKPDVAPERDLTKTPSAVCHTKRLFAAAQNAPRWADMRDMIENATKQECLDALTWIATKLGDET